MDSGLTVKGVLCHNVSKDTLECLKDFAEMVDASTEGQKTLLFLTNTAISDMLDMDSRCEHEDDLLHMARQARSEDCPYLMLECYD